MSTTIPRKIKHPTMRCFMINFDEYCISDLLFESKLSHAIRLKTISLFWIRTSLRPETKIEIMYSSNRSIKLFTTTKFLNFSIKYFLIIQKTSYSFDDAGNLVVFAFGKNGIISYLTFKPG